MIGGCSGLALMPFVIIPSEGKGYVERSLAGFGVRGFGFGFEGRVWGVVYFSVWLF